MQKIYTTKEMAELSGTSRSYIQDLCARKELQPLMASSTGEMYFCEEQLYRLEGYLRSHHDAFVNDALAGIHSVSSSHLH